MHTGSTDDASAPAPRSIGALLWDVYIAPSDAFSELARRPRFLPALAGFLAVQVTFVTTWLTHMDFVEFMRAQLAASGRPMPSAATMAPSTITALKWTMGVSGVAASVLLVLAIAGLLLFIFSFLLGARTSYRHCLAVVAWIAFATGIVTAGLMLTVMALRGEWSVPPDQILQAGPAAFLDRASSSPFVYALAQSLDVFTVWMLTLASIGMARTAQQPLSTAAATVVVLWLIVVLAKAALATLA